MARLYAAPGQSRARASLMSLASPGLVCYDLKRWLRTKNLKNPHGDARRNCWVSGAALELTASRNVKRKVEKSLQNIWSRACCDTYAHVLSVLMTHVCCFAFKVCLECQTTISFSAWQTPDWLRQREGFYGFVCLCLSVSYLPLPLLRLSSALSYFLWLDPVLSIHYITCFVPQQKWVKPKYCNKNLQWKHSFSSLMRFSNTLIDDRSVLQVTWHDIRGHVTSSL